MKNLIEALLKFQSKCPAVVKDSNNPFFKSKYADLQSIMETIQPVLTECGLLIVQPVVEMNVKTIIYHSSGECLESLFPIVSKDVSNPQAFLSGVTYARRGALQAILNLVTEDDDGNTVTQHAQVVKTKLDGILAEVRAKAKTIDQQTLVREYIKKSFNKTALPQLTESELSLVLDLLNQEA